jgi:hypothetical protein
VHGHGKKHCQPEFVRAGDDWLKSNLDAYVTWSIDHNSLLIVTWDEDGSQYPWPPPQPDVTGMRGAPS